MCFSPYLVHPTISFGYYILYFCNRFNLSQFVQGSMSILHACLSLFLPTCRLGQNPCFLYRYLYLLAAILVLFFSRQSTYIQSLYIPLDALSYNHHTSLLQSGDQSRYISYIANIHFILPTCCAYTFNTRINTIGHLCTCRKGQILLLTTKTSN